MDFDEAPRSAPDRLRNVSPVVIWAVAAVLATLVGGVYWVVSSARSPASAPAPMAARVEPVLSPNPAQMEKARADIAAAFEATPEFAPFFRKLGEHFPADRAQVVERLALRRLANPGEDNADIHLSEGLRTLRQTRGVVAAKADGPALSRIFDAQARLMAALDHSDPRLCVDFLYGGASDAFFAFSATNRAAVGEMAQANLDAIIDGQAKKIERKPPSSADFAALERALIAAGMSKAEIAALLDGAAPDPQIKDERMCEAGRTYLAVLKKMPDDLRLRIYGLAVELMARS